MNKLVLPRWVTTGAFVGLALGVAPGGLGSCHAPQVAVLGSRASPNRFDAQKERHGRWRVFYDDASTQLATDGRYRHGRPVGRWRYYSPKNVLARQEQYRWWKRGRLLIKEFYPNGKLAKQGQAQVVREGEVIHFYWFGPWQEYAETGGPVSRAWYKMGQLQRREPIPAR